MAILYLDSLWGNDGAPGTIANPKSHGMSQVFTPTAGDEIRIATTDPVDTGLSTVYESMRPFVRITGNQTLHKGIYATRLNTREGTWTRVTTTATVTRASHGLSTNDRIYVDLGFVEKYDLATIAVGWKLITVTGPDTFTFTCTNAGNTSGSIMWADKVSEAARYATWTRVTTTATVTKTSHGYLANDLFCVNQVSNTTTVVLNTVKTVLTAPDPDTFTFTVANSGDASGAMFIERAWVNNGANVTVGANATRYRQGGGAFASTVAAFTTGKVCHVKMDSTVDLSSFKIFSFMGGASVAAAANSLRIVLCSDSTGDTPIAGCDWKLNKAFTSSTINKFHAFNFTPFSTATLWTASQSVTVGDLRYIDGPVFGMVYRCTVSGTTGTYQPKWNMDGVTSITDNTATWIFDGWKALPNNVNSVAVYNDIDVGANTVFMEELVAFKDCSFVDCLSYAHTVGMASPAAIQRNTAYSVGDIRVPSPSFGSVQKYVCTQAGTTHATTEPNWDYHIPSFTTDGTTIWRCIGYQETMYDISEVSFSESDTLIWLYEGLVVSRGGFQGVGYTFGVFPSRLTQQANVGDSVLYHDCACYEVNDIIRINNTYGQEYTVTARDIAAGTITVSPTISSTAAIGSTLRIWKKTANLFSIFVPNQVKMLNTTVENLRINTVGSRTVQTVISGGWNADYTAVVGRTYLRQWNMNGINYTTNPGDGLVFKNIVHVNPTYAWLFADVSNATGRVARMRNCGAIATTASALLAGFNSAAYYKTTYCDQFFSSGSSGATPSVAALSWGGSNLHVSGAFFHGAIATGASGSNLDTTVGYINYIVGGRLNNGNGGLYVDEMFVANAQVRASQHGVNTGLGDFYANNLKTDHSGAGGGICLGTLRARLRNYMTGDTNPIYALGSIASPPKGAWILSEKHLGVAGNTRMQTYGAVIVNDTINSADVSGFSWKASITDAMYYVDNPCVLPIDLYVKCVASELCTFSIYMYRDNTGLSAGLFLHPFAIGGVGAIPLTAMLSGSAGALEKVTISFTPTESGVIRPQIIAYGGTTYNVWISKFNPAG